MSAIVGVSNFFLDPSIGIGETNTNIHKNCERYRLWRLVSVAYSRNKLALRKRLRNLNQKFQFSIFDSVRDIRVLTYDFFLVCGRFVGVKVGFGSIDMY